MFLFKKTKRQPRFTFLGSFELIAESTEPINWTNIDILLHICVRTKFQKNPLIKAILT